MIERVDSKDKLSDKRNFSRLLVDCVWTSVERAVWKHLQCGEHVNFNDWDVPNELSSGFIMSILTSSFCSSKLKSKGVHITGACFDEGLDLSGNKIITELRLENCQFNAKASFEGLLSSKDVSFTGSVFHATLNMKMMNIDGSLILSQVHCKESVQIDNAKIGGQVYLNNATFKALLSMSGIQCAGSSFRTNNANFSAVNLAGAIMHGDLHFVGVHCQGTLNMNGIQMCASSLEIQNSHFDNIQMIRAKIDGSLQILSSCFARTLNMGAIDIGGSLLVLGQSKFHSTFILGGASIQGKVIIDGATFDSDINLNEVYIGRSASIKNTSVYSMLNITGACVMGSLNFANVEFGDVDVSRSEIHNELRLGASIDAERLIEAPIRWARGACLNLKDSNLGVLQNYNGKNNALEGWPEKINMDGFSYSKLGSSMACEEANVLISWLERHAFFSPTLYYQLAQKLESIGHKDKANAIRYAGKERERNNCRMFSKSWLGLSMLKLTIGYGFGTGYFRSLIPVLILMLVGSILFANAATGENTIPLIGEFPHVHPIAFSLDLLLPGIELNKSHYSIQFTNWVEYYFYFHKMMGYLLAFFIVAGLTGLTKK